MAPLSRQAGGWGRCEGTVFVDATDPDYQALLAGLTTVRDQLTARPREDLLSIRGTEAERQTVTIPPPPAVRRPLTSLLPPGDWVALGTLSWTSASAGWTPNGDGLPRLDSDIEDNPLRLAGRTHRRGIGTHARSEIAYALEGRYDRFFCVVGAAESGGTVVFRVYGDDRCLFDSGVLHGMRDVKTVDVAVTQVKTLRLEVADAGDGIRADMANWASPHLLRAPGPGVQPAR
jgi:hypothetical protein